MAVSESWEEVTLGELTNNYDSVRVPVKQADRKPGPYPYYGASGVVDYVDGYLFDGEYLLIAEDGENLRSRQTPVAFLASGRFWVNNHAHIVQGNGRATTRFLNYALADTNISGYLTGSAMPKLTQGNMNRIPIRTPPRHIQDQIVLVLGSLDDKIELNRRMNRILEGMARAIFQAWFVDFEPVRAKAAGATHFPGMPQPVFDQLPDRLVASELGEIPEGWETGRLGDVMRHPRRAVKPEDIDTETPYVGLEHIQKKDISLPVWGVAGSVTSNKHRFCKGEFLFGKLRPYFHKVCVAPIEGVCSTDVVVISPENSNWMGFVLFHISSDAFVAYTTAASTGTKMPRTNWKDMSSYAVVLPPENISRAFSDAVHASLRMILANVDESRVLASIRDTLLPKLISGEMAVPAAEGGEADV